MEFVFKYIGKEIPNELRLLTKSLVGYSSIDDHPMYLMETNINKELINNLLYDVYEKEKYIENIRLFLRRFKTLKILNGTVDKEMDRFVTFLQYYHDYIDDIIVLQSNNSIK